MKTPKPFVERKFLHQGIANRSFERSFQLADYVYVESAVLKDGLLNITLIREIPEASKPRRIQINSDEPTLLQMWQQEPAQEKPAKAA